jgi:hypothetical protein
MQTPISYFTELTDPRVERSKEHLTKDIIFVAIAAVICGAETWNDIENYGKSKRAVHIISLSFSSQRQSELFGRRCESFAK